MTNKELLNKARILTGTSNQIRLIERVLENLEYLRIKEDNFPLHHQISDGLLNEINDSLELIRESVQQVSNDICSEVLTNGE